jgi:electron transfer flavoprotein beta subunit
MRVAVCLKYVPDPATVEVDPLTGEIDALRTLHILNPADATALELALRLRSQGATVTAFTVGPPEADSVLRDALSVGVDGVLRLWEESRTQTKPPVTAILLAAGLRTEGLPDLILCGARSVDRGSGKIPGLLGEYLNMAVVTDITQFDIDAGWARFQRRLARGARSEGDVVLPAVLGVEAGTTRLRAASLPGLMHARRATIPVRDLRDLGLSAQDLNFPSSSLHAALPPRPRPRAIFIPDTHLSPHERVSQIMSAGLARKAGQVLEGSPEAMADAMIAFLFERGFLERSR